MTDTPDLNDDGRFDALVDEAQKSQNAETMEALWSAVYELEKWYFVGRGEMPNIQPFIGMVEEKPFLMGFTNDKRAHEFALRHKLENDEGTIPILVMTVDAAVEYAMKLQTHGVVGVLFNDGPHGFFAPLQNLAPMLSHFADAQQDD